MIKQFLHKFYLLHIKKIGYVEYARTLGVRIGKDCQILTSPDKAFSTEPWLIKLGDHVDITQDVQFVTHEGGIWTARGLEPELKKYDLFAPIVVGNNVMIGMNSMIMPGVTIGNNVIIAAHSVVTKDVEDGMIVAGSPAKPISTVDKFVEKLKTRNLVPTKHMSAAEKRVYLQEHFPEWFK